MRKLSELNVGESSEILEFSDLDIALKMVELGCIPGESVRLEQLAPLGCPAIYRVGQQLLSIRKAEAEQIIVK